MEHDRHLRHLSDEELTSFWHGSASPEALELLDAHVDECEACENRLEALEPALARYRQCLDLVHERAGVCLPPTVDLLQKMDRMDACRPRRNPWAFRPVWFSGIAAAAACAALFVLPHLGESELRAETLLQQAASRPVQQYSTVRLRITTPRASFERSFGPTPAMAQRPEEQALQARFAEAHYDWSQPLNPRSYSDWRRNLRHKKSKVSPTHDAYGEPRQTIQTSTDEGALRDAELTLDAKLSPVSASFRFADHESVEIAIVPADTGEGLTLAPASSPSSTLLPPPTAPPPSASADTLAGRELDVRLAIDALQTGAGEPIEVSTDPTGVIQVATYGLAPQLEARLRTSLAPVSNVVVRAAIPAASPQPAPLEEPLDPTIRVSQDVLFEAHLLAGLASRFEASTEAGLSPSRRASLWDMRIRHAAELKRHLARLRGELERRRPSLRAVSAAPPIAALPQEIAQSAKLVGRLITELFAGSDPQTKQTPDWRPLASQLEHLEGLALRYSQDVEQHRKELP